MYFQLYNIKTGRRIMICPDLQSAQKMIQMMNDADISIEPIEKSDHPLARR
jgi:hypothetical protein